MRRSFGRLLLLLVGMAMGFGGLWLWHLERLSGQFLDSVRWTTPGRLYSRPLSLTAGSFRTAEQFVAELEQLRYVAAASTPGNGQFVRRAGQIAVGLQHAVRHGPVGSVVTVSFRAGRVEALIDAEGRALHTLAFEPVPLGTLDKQVAEDRLVIALADAPPLLVAGLQAVEDRSFKHHYGVSLRAVARAAWRNLRAGGVVEGGSTLTQQLVKNLYVDSGRTWWRKANEAALSVLIEARFSKADILQAYINQVYLGQQRGRAIHGVGLASQFYFGVPLQQLQPHQLALLIGMIRGPSWNNPWRNPERAEKRRNTVLDAMYETGLLSHSERLAWQGRRLDVVSQPAMLSAGGRGVAELVRGQLKSSKLGDKPGLVVETTLDPVLQASVGQAATEALAELERAHGLSGLDLAVVVVERDNAKVRALVGGRSGVGFNRALNAQRPIGSLVKPFVYLTALRRGGDYHLAHSLNDDPLAVQTRSGETWRPGNFDGRSAGEIQLLDALVQSRNVATVRLGLALGLSSVAATLARFGVEVPSPIHPSLLLGAHEMTPYQVAQAYLGLMSGRRATLSTVERVRWQGASYQPDVDAAASAPAASDLLLRYALQQVVEAGTAQSLQTMLGPAAQGLAGKTGSTNDLRDSWFVGIGQRYITVVWLGRDDNGPAGLSGARGAVPIYAAIFAQLNERGLEPLAGAEIEWHYVDAQGLRARESCAVRYLPFSRDSIPADSRRCKPKRGWWPFN